MSVLRSLRSLLAFVTLMLVFGVGGGLYQRLFLWPATRLWPHKRDALMWSFMIRMGGWVLGILGLGGARFVRVGRLPPDGPRLILMNHQSLLDIPTIFLLCAPQVPLIVTRRSFARGVPLVSLMLRIMEYPLIEPERDPRGSIATLKRAAERQRHGLLLFPEGHRTHHGELAPFETAGLRVLLRRPKIPVFLIVTDGFWASRKLFDAIFKVHEIRGRTEVLGPFESPDDREIPAFIEHMQDVMAAHLERMRRSPSPAPVGEPLSGQVDTALPPGGMP